MEPWSQNVDESLQEFGDAELVSSVSQAKFKIIVEQHHKHFYTISNNIQYKIIFTSVSRLCLCKFRHRKCGTVFYVTNMQA